MCYDCNYTGYREHSYPDGTIVHDYCDCEVGQELHEMINEVMDEGMGEVDINIFDILTPFQCLMLGILFMGFVALLAAILA